MYNNSTEQKGGNHNAFYNYNSIIQCSIASTLVIVIFLITASSSLPLGIDLQLTDLRAAVDIDVSGNGRAAASDGEESISTDGESFCSITNDIAGGKFSSLFEGIVDCGNDDLRIPNQFLVEYSYTKNPVKIGEKTYLTLTVKDRETGNPISNAFVKLTVGSTSQFETGTFSAALATAAAAIAGADVPTTSTQKVVEEKTTQSMYTDSNGHATFTVQLGPKSDTGSYDTEIEVSKDSYQSSFEQIDLQVRT